MRDQDACLWCSAPFRPRQDGGKRQRFCSSACRAALHRAARMWALEELEAGRVSIDRLKRMDASNVYVAPGRRLGLEATYPPSKVEEHPRTAEEKWRAKLRREAQAQP